MSTKNTATKTSSQLWVKKFQRLYKSYILLNERLVQTYKIYTL